MADERQNARILLLEKENRRLRKALEYTYIQRAHEYAVATGCSAADAFEYVDGLEEEAARRRQWLGGEWRLYDTKESE